MSRRHKLNSVETISPVQTEVLIDTKTGSGATTEHSCFTEEIDNVGKTSHNDFPSAVPSDEASEKFPVSSENNAIVEAVGVYQHVDETQINIMKQHLRSGTSVSDTSDSVVEMERVMGEMKMMENALQGATENLITKLSSASSLGSMEESYYQKTSQDSSDSLFERRNAGEATLNPYYMKSMTPGAFEAALRQKEGELASYMSRLALMESIRDSLAEELVKMIEQREKLWAEASTLPGIQAELESLRRRHSAVLELMVERDEELEELRADIIDLKEMYIEQVNLLMNKIQILTESSRPESHHPKYQSNK